MTRRELKERELTLFSTGRYPNRAEARKAAKDAIARENTPKTITSTHIQPPFPQSNDQIPDLTHTTTTL